MSSKITSTSDTSAYQTLLTHHLHKEPVKSLVAYENPAKSCAIFSVSGNNIDRFSINEKDSCVTLERLSAIRKDLKKHASKQHGINAALSIHENSKLIIAGNTKKDPDIHVWNLNDETNLTFVPFGLKTFDKDQFVVKHSKRISALFPVANKSNQDIFASASLDNQVLIWPNSLGIAKRFVTRLEHESLPTSFIKLQSFYITGTVGGIVRIWGEKDLSKIDVKTYSPRKSADFCLPDFKEPITSLLALDEFKFLVGTTGEILREFDIRKIEQTEYAAYEYCLPQKGISSLCSLEGRKIAWISGSVDSVHHRLLEGDIYTFDLLEREINVLKGHYTSFLHIGKNKIFAGTKTGNIEFLVPRQDAVSMENFSLRDITKESPLSPRKRSESNQAKEVESTTNSKRKWRLTALMQQHELDSFQEQSNPNSFRNSEIQSSTSSSQSPRTSPRAQDVVVNMTDGRTLALPSRIFRSSSQPIRPTASSRATSAGPSTSSGPSTSDPQKSRSVRERTATFEKGIPEDPKGKGKARVPSLPLEPTRKTPIEATRKTPKGIVITKETLELLDGLRKAGVIKDNK